ncbi:zinc finger protein ZXDC isoform X1 [Lagenorhynchus albirostris]|uniref:zinc finger protein ZXDC isoform X1 n=1 Tax=Lagenorhynchus albirostris TaxID=27610 RepID=UPI0028E7B93C|nr:zinc finger protein ZXDC isoform X1 [Lagenorhynchus albirostris]
MDAPALLAAAAPAPRGPQLGGGPGRTRRTPGSAHRRLLLLRDPEDGAQGPRRGEARPAGPGGGDSFVVLLEVARGAAEAPGRRETEPQPGAAASPADRPAQVPGAAPLVGPRAAGGQDLLVHLERGVLALAAPSRRPPPGQEAASPAGARRASAGPGYRCPEPQCALAFAKKHQLQVHLLTHGGGQGRRPFKCPLDGCGWAFTTSYKLKRHLQSHDKLRPFGCPVGGCGKKFTTVYNLRAHMKGHEQESLFKCEVCAERFPTHAKLSSHQRSHFEPERPYKCDFPGCEKTFITVSALFSHNRAHFREQELFSCSFPGCSKQYDKACRLKIHLRSHTGERPFICDSDSCGWTFTSMSKLLRHKRKHDEDRRFPCPVEGCGKSFTRAEHLKGHSVTHLGTKPFACPVEGCCARFSARSSLYIHSKKHLQDVAATKSRCPVSSCHRLFASKHSVKAHVIRQHPRHPDLFPPLGAPSALAPSSDLSSPGQSEFSSVDLAVLFSDTPGDSGGAPRTSDEALRTGILTVDVTSVSASLGGGLPASQAASGPMGPLVLVAHSDVPLGPDRPLVLGTAATVLQQGSLAAGDVQAVDPGALGCLVALPMKSLSRDPQALTSASGPQGDSSAPELLVPIKVEPDSAPDPDAVRQQAWSGGAPQPVESSPAEELGPRKDAGLGAGTGGFYLLCDVGQPGVCEPRRRVAKGPQEGGGSARTDSRAIQLAKEKKQRGAGSHTGAAGPALSTGEGDVPAGPGAWLWGSLAVPGVALPCVQVQLLQDDPSGHVVFPLAPGPQPPVSHPLLAVMPVCVLQEVLPAAGGATGPEDMWSSGSTVGLWALQ